LPTGIRCRRVLGQLVTVRKWSGGPERELQEKLCEPVANKS